MRRQRRFVPAPLPPNPPVPLEEQIDEAEQVNEEDIDQAEDQDNEEEEAEEDEEEEEEDDFADCPPVELPTVPYFHRVNIDYLRYIKIIIGTIFILPLRVISMAIVLLIAWLLSFLVTMFLSLEELRTQPLSWWRRLIRWFVARCLLRLFFFCAGFYWIKIKGKPCATYDAPIILAAPHSSYFDAIAIILASSPIPSVVAYKGADEKLFVGQLLNMLQSVFFERDDPADRRIVLKDRIELIREDESDTDWFQVFVFAESTRTNRSCLTKFSMDAFNRCVPVQPVLIKYPNRMDTVTTTYFGQGKWESLWLTLAQFVNHCELEFLPFYKPKKDDRADPEIYAANVRRIMANALEIPLTDYDYDDVLILNELKTEHIIHKLRVVAAFRHARGISIRTERELSNKVANQAGFEHYMTKLEFLSSLTTDEDDDENFDTHCLDIMLSVFFKKELIFRVDRYDIREYLVYAFMSYPAFSLNIFYFPIYMMYSGGQTFMNFRSFNEFVQDCFYLRYDESQELYNRPVPGRARMHIEIQISINDFKYKIKKHLEYMRLLALETIGYLEDYPTRGHELALCKEDEDRDSWVEWMMAN